LFPNRCDITALHIFSESPMKIPNGMPEKTHLFDFINDPYYMESPTALDTVYE